jgi:hypothetical protein
MACAQLKHRGIEVGSCEHSNEPSDSDCEWLLASEEGLCYMELINWYEGGTGSAVIRSGWAREGITHTDMYEGVSESFRTESITKYTLTTTITQKVMAAKLARLTHKVAIQLHIVAESCTICSSRSRRPARKLLDTPSYALHVPCLIWRRISSWPTAPPRWTWTRARWTRFCYVPGRSLWSSWWSQDPASVPPCHDVSCNSRSYTWSRRSTHE